MNQEQPAVSTQETAVQELYKYLLKNMERALQDTLLAGICYWLSFQNIGFLQKHALFGLDFKSVLHVLAAVAYMSALGYLALNAAAKRKHLNQTKEN